MSVFIETASETPSETVWDTRLLLSMMGHVFNWSWHYCKLICKCSSSIHNSNYCITCRLELGGIPVFSCITILTQGRYWLSCVLVHNRYTNINNLINEHVLIDWALYCSKLTVCVQAGLEIEALTKDCAAGDLYVLLWTYRTSLTRFAANFYE